MSVSPGHETFRVLLLGPLAVLRGGVPLESSTWQRSVQTLLKLLATAPQRRRLREEIVDVLWPDALPETGASNLRYVVHRLRRELGGGDPPPILSDRAWIALNPAYQWDIDLDRFERLAERVGGDPEAAAELAGLYRGEPLPEDRYDDWAVPLRSHLVQTWQRVCRTAAETLERAGRADEALSWLDRALEGDPLDEESLRESLRLLVLRSRRPEALRRYAQFEEQLRAEMDLEPAPETRKLVGALRAGTLPTGSIGANPGSARPERDLPTETVPQTLREGGYLGALPVSPLVGRTGEEAALERAVQMAHEGQSRLALLVGEPGVGKTRLAQEATRIAHEAGFLVAAGRCYEPERLVPYYPFREVLATLSEAVPPALQEEAPRRWPYLARLLPGGELTAAQGSGRDADDELLLMQAVTAFVHTVADTVPLAILLDDLHWADEASLKLLLHLTRRTQRHRIFLLGTYRDLDVGVEHPLVRGVLDLSREDMVEVVSVQPLALPETRTLVAQTLGAVTVPERLAEAVQAATDGNAFFTQQVARSLLEEGRLTRAGDDLDWRGDARIAPPQSVRLVVGRRLVRLLPATQEVLAEASVLGQTFSFLDLADMSRRAEEELEAALAEAERAGLVRETGIDLYSFSHALAQGTVYDGIPARRRRRLHGEAGRAIEERSEKERVRRVAELARHFIEAGDRGRALRYSLLAGEAAGAVFGHAEAERHYRNALRLAREGEDRALEARALEKLGSAVLQRGAYDEALECLDEADRLYRSLGLPDDQARTLAAIGDVYWWRGSARDGLQRLRDAVQELGGGTPSSGLAWLYSKLAELGSDRGDIEASVMAAERASEIARAAGDDTALVHAENQRVWALWKMGRSADALETVEALLPLAEGGSNLMTFTTTLLTVANTSTFRGELKRSVEYRERLLDVCIRLANPVAIVVGHAALGAGLFMVGRWDEARQHLEAALDMAREVIGPGSPELPLLDLGNLEVNVGNWERGRQLLEEAQTIAEERESLGFFRVSQLFLANLDLLEGDPDRAVERLTPLVDHPGLGELEVTPLLPVLARAYLRKGDCRRAAKLLSEARLQTKAQQNRLDLAVTLSVQLELARVLGEWDSAEGIFKDLLSMAQTMGFRVLEGDALLEGARLALERGDPETAGRRGEASLAIFRELGARKGAEAAEAMLERVAAGATDWGARPGEDGNR